MDQYSPTRLRGLHRARRSWIVPALLPILLAAAGLAYSQLEIDRWSLHGGGSGAGGALTLDGAVGQPVAGVSSGGTLSLEGGFWIPEEADPSGVPPLESPPARFASFGFAPNPLRDRTTLTLDLPREVHLRAEAYSVSGARVALLLDRTVSAGRLRATWNAIRDDGRRLAAGVYLIRIEAGGDRATERLVVLE